MTPLTLVSFAALLAPFDGFIHNISWIDGEPVDVILTESALRHFGQDWHSNHVVWKLFDALDTFNINYGFAVENNNG